MGEQQFRPDRPDTLGQAWRGMPGPPQRKPRDLPTLPDWPPLPNEPSQAAWPALGPSIPDESHPADALQPTERDDTLFPRQRPAAPPPPPPQRGLPRRFRGASKRAKLGIAVVLVVLIVAGSGLALHTIGSAPGGFAATQGQNGSPHALPTVTLYPTHQPTLTPTSTPTATPAPPLTLAFTCASGSLHGTGQVCVHTLPRATLSLSVRYCDGSTAKGLHGDVTADGSGNYTWSWQVRTACSGAATATVTANWNGQSLTQSDTFTITK